MQYIDKFENDVIQTSKGPLQIFFIGRSALIFKFNDKTIHVDPIMREADYSQLPKADIILITHEHHDHCDPEAVESIKHKDTHIICPDLCAEKIENCTIMNNNEKLNFYNIHIESIPAYNIKHMRHENVPFHPKGHGNGYVIFFGDTKVYIAGDTENIPEMKSLENIDIAFLPMNLPVTMSPEMVEDAVRSIKPKIFYPYHYGDTAMKWGESDPNIIVEKLKDLSEVEVRIRDMK